MPVRGVVDASVLGAAFFNESGSEAARRFLVEGPSLTAPDLLFIEIASLAAKKVWRGEAEQAVGVRALASIPDFVDEIVAVGELSPRAFELAAGHRFSAYDAAYLALAERRGTPVITLDEKLVNCARAEGFGALVEKLPA